MRWKRQRRSGLKIKKRNKCLVWFSSEWGKPHPVPPKGEGVWITKKEPVKQKFHRLRCISWAYNVKCVGMTRLELATTRPPDVYANQLRYIPWLCTMYNLLCTIYYVQFAIAVQRYEKLTIHAIGYCADSSKKCENVAFHHLCLEIFLIICTFAVCNILYILQKHWIFPFLFQHRRV